MLVVIVVVAVVLAVLALVGFLMLVFTLVPAVNQMKSLMVDVEKTSSRTRDLLADLQSVSGKVDRDLDKIDEILESSKETVNTVKHSLEFVNKNVIRSSAGLLALIPAIKFGWDLVKKFKGGKNV